MMKAAPTDELSPTYNQGDSLIVIHPLGKDFFTFSKIHKLKDF